MVNSAMHVWLASERESQGLPVVCCPPRRLLGWGEQIGTDVAWSILYDRRIRLLLIIANIYHKIKIFSPQIWASIKMKNSIISWYQMPFLTSYSILIIFFLDQVIVQVSFWSLAWQPKLQVILFSSEYPEVIMMLFFSYPALFCKLGYATL